MMDFEKEISDLKERVKVAEQDGRNPFAIQAKFETLFNLVQTLQDENAELRGLISKIVKINRLQCSESKTEEILKSQEEPKKRKSRPRREILK